LDEEQKQLESLEVPLEKMGLSPADVKRAIDPIQSFDLLFPEMVENCQRLERGAFAESGIFRACGNP